MEIPSARQVALRRLSIREYSSGELRTYLERKEFREEEIQETIVELKRQRLLDDERFTESMVKILSRRGKGPALIRQYLRQKGVDCSLEKIRKLYKESSTSQNPELAELEAAQKLIGRRYPRAKGTSDKPADAKIYRRAMGALLRRGFSSDVVRKALGKPPQED